MKNILVIFLLSLSLSAFAQTKQDTLIDREVQPASGNYIPKKALNPVLHEMLGNRVTNYGNRTLLDEIITFTGIKVKFGNSAEIGPLSGSDTLTAPDADPLKFRVDLLVVNRNGTTAIITGTPGEQGIDPPYDVANQIPVYRILVNDRGVGTVTPVTYATLSEVRAGILTNVALSPNTYMTVTQELIDEALAGIMVGGGGGHILKNNATTLTQRPALRILTDTDGDARDSSAISESILDLRGYKFDINALLGGQDDYTTSGVIKRLDDGKIGARKEIRFAYLGPEIVTGGFTQITTSLSPILNFDPSYLAGGAFTVRLNGSGTQGLIQSVTAVDYDYKLIVNGNGDTVQDTIASLKAGETAVWVWSNEANKFFRYLKPRSLDVSGTGGGGGGGSTLTKVIRDTTNTSANTLIIDKVSGANGVIYSHQVDDIRWSMYGGSYGTKYSATNPGLEISRGDNAIGLFGGDGSTDGSDLDFSGIRGNQSYWLSSFFTTNHFAQKGYVDAAISTAISGSGVGTTTNALSAGTGLAYTSGSTFNGSAARTLGIDATVATLPGSQTLQNKTLTSPVINSGSLGSSTVANTQTAGDNSTKVSTTAYADLAADNAKVSTAKTYTQSSHGFVAGDVLKKSGGVWAKAQANTEANSEVLGVVESVTTNTFRLVFAGEISLSGLTTESNYFLSSSTAGTYTLTAPTSSGTVNKPVFFSISTTTAIVQIQRGITN